MKAQSITATSTSSRLTGIQWLIAVVGIVTAITCILVLLSETLRESNLPTSFLHIDWKTPAVDKVTDVIQTGRAIFLRF